MNYNMTTNSYNFINSTDSSRSLWSFGNFFHSIGNFVKRTFNKVKTFVKKDGPKILKYGALAALSAVDILADPKDGIEHTIQNFKSGNIWQAVKNTGEDAANAWLPPYVSIHLDFVADTCFSNPHLHCTWKGAENAAKKDILPYV